MHPEKVIADAGDLALYEAQTDALITHDPTSRPSQVSSPL